MTLKIMFVFKIIEIGLRVQEMDFLKINLEETKSAIRNLTKNNENFEITVKKIRKIYKIKSSNKSKINFT